MSDVSKFNILGQIINVKDTVARTQIGNLTEKVNSAINEIYLTEMVVLGDSFAIGLLSDGTITPTNMSMLIANSLHLNLHNYGVGGAGYTIEGNTFQAQLNTAINDTSYNHTKVKYVFVIGGINDMNFNKTADHGSASRQLQVNIHSAFPNAKIVITPCWAAPSLTNSDEQIFRNICTVPAAYTNTITLYDNIKCLMGYSNLLGSDHIHPTVEGYTVLAENIISLLYGNGLARGKQATLVSNSNWDIAATNVFRGEDFVRIFGFARAKVDITNPSQLVICEVQPGAPFSGSVLKNCPSADRQVLITFNPSDDLAGTNGSIILTNDYSRSVLANDMIFFNELIPLINL